METPASMIYEGGCHCGAVRFRVKMREHKAIRCNCSICTKKGFLHLLVAEEDFELLRGADALTTYTFGTHTARHHFCQNCGIHSYYRPRSHPEKIDVNVRCLDGIEADAFEVIEFDGRNWEGQVDELRKRLGTRQ